MNDRMRVSVGDVELVLSNLQKVLFPAAGYSKLTADGTGGVSVNANGNSVRSVSSVRRMMSEGV